MFKIGMLFIFKYEIVLFFERRFLMRASVSEGCSEHGWLCTRSWVRDVGNLMEIK